MKDYQWYKSNGICVRCRKKAAEPGRVMCTACSEVARLETRERLHNSTPEQKANRSTSHKNWYEYRKAQHICTRCGKLPPVENRTLCESCLSYQREWYRKKSSDH